MNLWYGIPLVIVLAFALSPKLLDHVGDGIMWLMSIYDRVMMGAKDISASSESAPIRIGARITYLLLLGVVLAVLLAFVVAPYVLKLLIFLGLYTPHHI